MATGQKQVKKLMNSGVPCDWLGPEGDITALIAAAQEGHREVAALLLAKGASVDKTVMVCGNEKTALMGASRNGYLKIVELLLSKGANVNLVSQPLGVTPLMVAAGRGHCAVMDAPGQWS